MEYIDSPVYNYTETQINEALENTYAKDNVDDRDYSITRGLLLFWLSFFNLNDEDIVVRAVEYWETLSSLAAYKNPLTHAFYGNDQKFFAELFQRKKVNS